MEQRVYQDVGLWSYSEKELEGDGLRPVSEKREGLIIPHPQRSIYCVLVVNSSSFSVAT